MRVALIGVGAVLIAAMGCSSSPGPATSPEAAPPDACSILTKAMVERVFDMRMEQIVGQDSTSTRSTCQYAGVPKGANDVEANYVRLDLRAGTRAVVSYQNLRSGRQVSLKPGASPPPPPKVVKIEGVDGGAVIQQNAVVIRVGDVIAYILSERHDRPDPAPAKALAPEIARKLSRRGGSEK